MSETTQPQHGEVVFTAQGQFLVRKRILLTEGDLILYQNEQGIKAPAIFIDYIGKDLVKLLTYESSDYLEVEREKIQVYPGYELGYTTERISK